MNLIDLLRAARGVLAHRGRAILTLLGIVIGAGSIVLLASLLEGGREALVRTSQRASEADLLEVGRDDVPARQRDRTRRELSRQDAEVLADSPALADASVASEASRQTYAVVDGKKKKRITMVSAAPGAAKLYRLELASGRFVDTGDLAERRRVCVVGHEVWEELLSDRSDKEPSVDIDGRPFAVIGVLASKPMLGSTDGTNIWNRKVLVPETTYDALYAPSHQVRRIYVRASDAEPTHLQAFERLIRSVLLRRHFGVSNFSTEARADKDEERLILDIVELLLLSTGLLALFVGGINVMNIMLVTVTERTREIGVRRAVGARRGTILAQFLVESAFVSLVGGLLGVVGGALLSWLATLALRSAVGQWSFHLEAWSVGLALALSAATGIVFGLYPAWRAARLDPIQALRFE